MLAESTASPIHAEGDLRADAAGDWGTYDGVGITIAFRNEMLTIVAVREEGPAARAGVLPGDQIIKVNDILADNWGWLRRWK